MDYQKLIDSVSTMACVMSVEKLPDGGYGAIRIEVGNKAYIDSVEHPAPGAELLRDTFVPGLLYTEYTPKDLNFEDFLYHSAVEKKCIHAYVHPERSYVWFNMTGVPLNEEGNIYYCIYMLDIQQQQNSEEMSNNVSADIAASVLDTCIKLRGTSDFNAALNDVVAGIRKLCDADHCCILAVDEYNQSCRVLGESFAEGTDLLPMETYIDSEFYDIADSWKDTIAGSNCLIAKDDHDMEVVKERNPVWYESLTSAGARNIVLFPLKSRNQLLGYIWVLNFDKELALKIKETLEITTFILGSELGNYLLLDRLRLIGSKDMLTGVLNRNEMNNVVDELCHGSKDDKAVGVIFADLNGLKTVNDVDGHNAGDLLLKNAAAVLRSVFKEDEIFRAGGDEFAIITSGITEKELEDKIKKIRKGSEKYDDLSFALGGCVEQIGSNVRLALRRADEMMYEDKRRFYEKFPEEKQNDRRRRGAPKEAVSREDTAASNILLKMNYDQLTGLPSMSYFLRLAESGRTRMHDENIPSALVFIDLNGMRFYNKKHGFAEGDVLLKEFAQILSKSFGNENCSRFGIDHFVVYTEEKDIEKRLERVFKDMKRANGGKAIYARAGIYLDSMGIVETSLACDRAKYACDASRISNRSYFTYYDKKMLAEEINRQYIVDNLDRAIAENWIMPYYQPIVRTMGRKVCDEEALARWIDPEKGMLSPADFIPVLEDSRLIYKVDLHIVDVVLERIRKQMNDGMTVVPISINLSRTDFEYCDIVEEIKNRVDGASVSRQMITIEITESVVGENFDYMKEQIERFQELGFAVWMDDFGSGYSSLDVLQELKVDLIKFDMRFMRQFEKSPRSRVILTELMRMAMSLGIETVTEGVETLEQVEFLSEIGCTKMQGYYFCKPVSIEEIQKRIKDGKAIGFEDPDEGIYHTVVGSINLYDLSAITTEEGESIKHYFNTIPMGVCESDGKYFGIIRSNKSYREFIDSFEKRKVVKKDSEAILEAVRKCRKVGDKVFFNEETDSGDNVIAVLRKIADNPVNGLSAYAVAVLNYSMESERRRK